MKCREVITRRGDEYILTEEEEKYARALERLSKMDAGRIRLFANGIISVRFIDEWQDDSIDGSVSVFIKCEGGDGGD